MGREKDRGSLICKWAGQLEGLAIVILAFYPLRHIGWGLDLCDIGYNYANYQYAGIRHMDSMWFFSTYLTNMVGSLLTKLPKGHSLVGMNFYTGLFASALALMGYFFCTRELKIPKVIAFLGEMTALSLCWCPTAVLYNYLTYLLFQISCILLYFGLTRERKGYLIGAGALLGANVLVRFPNLSNTAMILAVWAYDVILWLEERRKTPGKQTESFWRRTARHTLWCMVGYIVTLAVLLHYIHIRFGIRNYIAGISRLFSMTENATGYKPTTMVKHIIGGYMENMYWVIRIGVIVAGGIILFVLVGWVKKIVCGYLEIGSISSAEKKMENRKKAGILLAARTISIGARILWAGVCVTMILWLYDRKFCSLLFQTYAPILHSGPLFLMLTMLIAVIRIFYRDSTKEERLISGMLILIILLTPLGSNNGVMQSFNNLFLAAPYALWGSWRFITRVKDRRTKYGVVVSSFPVKGVLIAFLGLCLFEFWVFGAKFAFAEGTGIQSTEATVDNSPVLRNVKMSPEKAEWMTSLNAYVNEEGLQGKEVVLYGYIPALSYYLQMPSAFNPWSDLASYSPEAMSSDLAQLEGEIIEKGKEKPVVILESLYGTYMESLTEYGQPDESLQWLDGDPKWMLLLEFMEKFGYEQTFRNEKFAVYR